MKVVFLKDHVVNKQGETADLEGPAANYLIRVGVCEPAKEKKEIAPAKEKAEKSPAKEKKEI
jgi:ribosomal protein L9